MKYNLDDLFEARPHFDAEMLTFASCDLNTSEDPLLISKMAANQQKWTDDFYIL